MARLALAQARTAGLQAPNAHLPSLATWRCHGSPQTATALDEVLVSQVSRGPAGLAGQSGKEDSRGGWRESADPSPTAQPCPHPAPPPTGAPYAPGLDPQARYVGK